jgi:nitrogen PTS system EIIA component
VPADNADFTFPTVDLPPAVARSPDAIVRFLVEQLVQAGKVPPALAERALQQVMRRESQGSTGIGRCVALPHSKTDAINEVVGIYGRSDNPIDWPGAVDGLPVHVVCLLLTPSSEPTISFRALEAVTRQLRKDPGGRSDGNTIRG